MQYIILGSGVLSLFLGILALSKGEKTREVISFGVFCIITSLWIFSNILSLAFALENAFFLKLTYAFGAFAISALLAWSFFYSDKRYGWRVFAAIYCSGIAMAIFSLINGFIVGEVYSVTVQGISVEKGPYSDVFSAYLLLVIIWSLVNIALLYRRFEGAKKNQAKMVLIGVSGFMLTILFVSAVLPIFGIFAYTNLDSPSSLIFVLFTMVAVVKHKLLGTKVIWAQILVSILVTTSLIQLFDSQDAAEYIANALALIIVLIVGIFLVRSVMSEVRRQEELQAMAEQLSLANDELRMLNVVKSEFVSIAAHQIRTPLSGIRWGLETLSDGVAGALPKEAKEIVDSMSENTLRLIRLIDELLNVSRIDTGKSLAQAQPTEVVKLVAEVCKSLEVSAHERSVHLLYDKKHKGFDKVMIDPKQLFVAVENVVSNAVKYTPAGGTIRVALRELHEQIEVSVADTGIGIPKREQKEIFTEFFRAHNAVLKDVEGSGLGLHVVKLFIEEAGGTVRFESKEGEGTIFFISLPKIKKE